jgi:hypothetical protein
MLGRLLWGRRYAATEFLNADLAAGEAEILACSVEAYASGEEVRDEGPKLFLDTGAGVLVLFGQWLLDPHVVTSEMSEDAPEEEWFREFEMVRAPRSGIVFSFKAHSTQTVRPTATIAARDIPFLLPSMLLPGGLADVKRRLLEFDASLQRAP